MMRIYLFKAFENALFFLRFCFCLSKVFIFFNLLYTFCVQCVIIFYIQILEIFSSLGITLFAFFQKSYSAGEYFCTFRHFEIEVLTIDENCSIMNFVLEIF